MEQNNIPPSGTEIPLSANLKQVMQACPQNPRYHAEGDVWAHTELVLSEFYLRKNSLSLTPEEERILYWACIVHDVGKPLVTREESGRITAAGHEYAGVHIARSELLKHSNLSSNERRKVLDIVRWHHIPFRWGREGRPLEEYTHLSYKTDIRLLALFAQFDFNGRICENQEDSVRLIDDFGRKIEPQIRYHHGSFSERVDRFTRLSELQKDAFWYALRNRDFILTQKLLNANPDASLIPYRNTVHFSWVQPGMETELDWAQLKPNIPVIKLSDFNLTNQDTDTFSLDRRSSELAWHLSVLKGHYPEMILEGELHTEPLWTRVTEICRRQRFIPKVSYIESQSLFPNVSEYPKGLKDNNIRDFHFMNPHPFAFHDIDHLVL
jgi:hypothetical protein